MSENLADRPCAVCYHMFKIEALRDTTCIDCMEDELEALRNKVAVLGGDRDGFRTLCEEMAALLQVVSDRQSVPYFAVDSALSKYRALDTKAQP